MDQVRVWHYNATDPAHVVIVDVVDVEGRPFSGNAVQLMWRNGITQCMVTRELRVGTGALLSLHSCEDHRLVLVRWAPGGYDGYDLPGEVT